MTARTRHRPTPRQLQEQRIRRQLGISIELARTIVDLRHKGNA